jgi:hypothetical protein
VVLETTIRVFDVLDVLDVIGVPDVVEALDVPDVLVVTEVEKVLPLVVALVHGSLVVVQGGVTGWQKSLDPEVPATHVLQHIWRNLISPVLLRHSKSEYRYEFTGAQGGIAASILSR